MKRRLFLLSAAGSAGALIVGWGVMPPRSRLGSPEDFPALAGEVALNGWIKVTREGRLILAMPQAEMGQGVHTALPMLVAEELDLPLSFISLETAGSASIYGNIESNVGILPLHPSDMQAGHETRTARTSIWLARKVFREMGIISTGGSSSVADAWEPLRWAAASARAQLLGAASQRWAVPIEQLSVIDGVVHHGQRSAHFGELASAAAGRTVAHVQLKSRAQWRLLGTPAPRLDVPSKITGQAQYGIDMRLPEMLFAVARMCPILGGRVGKLRNLASVLAMRGVEKMVALPSQAGSTEGLAILARSTWHAKQAVQALDIEWLPPLGEDGLALPATALLDSERILADLRARAQNTSDGFAFYSRGDIQHAETQAAASLQAVYSAPYLAHATMEPMNATAQLKDGQLSLWVPTQIPSAVRELGAKAAGVPVDKVHLHMTLLGGGFGRRLEVDSVLQAVTVAQAAAGRPVQLVWTREEDMTHDFYRPASAAFMKASWDGAHRLQSLRIHSAGDAITPRMAARNLSKLATPFDLPDKTAMEGLFDLPYGVPHQEMKHLATRHGVPIGFWRSVGHSHHAFFSESFIDEIAAAERLDPVQFRRSLLSELPRYRAVLDLAASKAGWGLAVAAGHARGVALHASFGTIVAQVAEVSILAGQIKVHRVVCAVDCGMALNPGIIAQQMEGSVIFGLTAALYGRIDVKAGAVVQQSFPQYPLLSMAEAPLVETHIVPSDQPPSGMGEPGLPPLAPAVANAVFALTGQRLRSLPLQLA